MASGGLEPVEVGSGKHSPFARAIMRVLRDNEEITDGTRLFQEILKGVVLDALNTRLSIPTFEGQVMKVVTSCLPAGINSPAN